MPLTIDSETVYQVVPCFLHKIMFIFYLTFDLVWELLQDYIMTFMRKHHNSLLML